MSRYRTAALNAFAEWEEEFRKITFMTAISNTSPHLKCQAAPPALEDSSPSGKFDVGMQTRRGHW